MDPRGEVIMLGIRLRPELQSLRKRDEGGIIYVEMSALGRSVMAIVPRTNSQARREGHDIQFPTCKLNCAKALEATIIDEGLLVEGAPSGD